LFKLIHFMARTTFYDNVCKWFYKFLLCRRWYHPSIYKFLLCRRWYHPSIYKFLLCRRWYHLSIYKSLSPVWKSSHDAKNDMKNFRHRHQKHHFQQYFIYIVAVSFIDEGNRSTRRKPSTWLSHWQTVSYKVVSSTPRQIPQSSMEI
jgi:hypothetical protein